MVPALAAGAKVRVRTMPPEAHTRTPYYLRGKEGVVVCEVGIYRDPAKLAFHKPGLPMRRLYRICFHQRDIWSGYRPAQDKLYADLYESWLETAEPSARREDN